MINILIADDHALIRQGLKKLIEMEKDMKVVAEVSNGEEAYKIARELMPDIILMDINMPRSNGIKAAKMLKEENSNTKIIFLTIYDDREYLIEAFKIGVEGYVLKDADSDELIKAIRIVKNGGIYIQPSLLNVIKNVEKNDFKKDLTKREFEILSLIAKGYTNKDIAENLYLSEKTVKNHVYNIFKKLDVKDRTQAAIYLIKNRNTY
ncbi:response regulator transcription factor [Aceticella autotrophica]|uniref:Stage 0 sporulation protein A homolog n=1 Tax=Aceticella autotrophica TaxID=2755338 RepID=A0A975AWS2_9THEO|nr:response regulator transcription factor [Aceticella autotrophica]QSZ27900.1 response regulator transcription factor [Aceticella autotrophica]